MKMKFVFAALMGLLPVQSFAGVEHGNGGGVIICQNNPKIELLDFYEQRQLYKLTLDQGYGSESDYKKIAKFWLAKHAGIAIFREALWGKFVDEFESHVEWLDGVTLGETNDVGGAIIPAGCKFELAVIQETPSEIRPRRFYVNRDIWSRLEPAQRAGLVLHESVYREALLYGHDNSKVTRYFVSIWTSVGIYKDLASRVLLNQLLQRNHFLAGDFDGCTPELYRHTKLPNGSLLPDWNQPLETYWRFDGYWSNSSIFSDIPIELMSRHGELKANCLEVKYWKSDLLSRILQPVQGEWGNGILKVRVEPDFDTATSRFEVTKNFVAEDQS
ncbi:MAG: hypothetical protein NTV34_19100, partial [Proteobacteria bacterium]|nr:hypothetical protein [Pseudomonadota bacterium]